MSTKKLMMPLALLMGMLMSLTSFGATNRHLPTTTGVPFTLKYLRNHNRPVQAGKQFVAGRVTMNMGRTQAGLFTDWNITVSNDNYSHTWRTSDSSQGSVDNYQSNYYEFRSFSTDAIPPGIYTVTVQANNWGAYRDDIVIGGDNNTGSSVWDFNAYDNPYTVYNIEVTADGDGIYIGTTTNY
ncbi:hypothetical protein MUGA111182_03275 [Mucilaginibacter galii]|uniref:Uncharacterized protein n=1 Tax=Mucilaginibacter galii TaxID=2005073 RepID=A0A917JAC3_9SPHI|nr:hypothetical protein [Mucilaginibacter galii]GGI50411.1 hypothetical protein GCM10011425_16230 [Mucilaginibacter galii]